MAGARGDSLARRTNNSDSRRFTAAKEIANAHRRSNRFKIKFVLPQGKNVDLKVRENVVRRIRIRRRAIFVAVVRNRQY